MKLSIIIPNRNDTVMLGITVRSTLEALKSVGNDGEIIVVDNSDEDIWRIIKKPNVSPCPLGYTDGYIQNGKLKLIRQDYPAMYSAYDSGVKAAKGEYIMKSDSHVIYGHNVLKDCVDFMDSHPNVGFCFSPICWWNIDEKFAKSWIMPNKNGGIFGSWGTKTELPRKICWNFGFRIVRKDWYNKVGGFGFFADNKMSWGGGEFFIALKSWLFGRENWAINANPVYHIGPYSKEVESLGNHYRVYIKSGSMNLGIGILSAFYALGGNEAKKEALKSKEGLMKQYNIDVDKDWERAREYAEEDRKFIEQNQVISFEELLAKKPWDKK